MTLLDRWNMVFMGYIQRGWSRLDIRLHGSPTGRLLWLHTGASNSYPLWRCLEISEGLEQESLSSFGSESLYVSKDLASVFLTSSKHSVKWEGHLRFPKTHSEGQPVASWQRLHRTIALLHTACQTMRHQWSCKLKNNPLSTERSDLIPKNAMPRL